MVALGGMVAPSFRSEKKTSAPGADGVGPPVGFSWAKAMPHAAALTISNVIAGLTNLDDLPASARHTSILVLHCEPDMHRQYIGVSGARANCASDAPRPPAGSQSAFPRNGNRSPQTARQTPGIGARMRDAPRAPLVLRVFPRNAAIRRRRRRTGSS